MADPKKISGKKISKLIHSETESEVKKLKEEHNIQPGLAVVLVGDDPASSVYVGMKEKKAQELGIKSVKKVLDKNTSMEEVLSIIDELNNDPSIHGILFQSPPPDHIDEEKVINNIDPLKDVDCFHPENVGKMLIGKKDSYLPCTPHGVLKLLEYSEIDPSGKHAVILGRSNIVGKPLMALLVQKAKGANATVTVCHSRTKNIQEIAASADILIAAIGKTQFVTSDMVKDGAVVIDVGVNRIEDSTKKKGYRLVGDVDYNAVYDKVSKITPVPGGVGPMTIAMLMQNTIKACKAQTQIN